MCVCACTLSLSPDLKALKRALHKEYLQISIKCLMLPGGVLCVTHKHAKR